MFSATNEDVLTAFNDNSFHSSAAQLLHPRRSSSPSASARTPASSRIDLLPVRRSMTSVKLSFGPFSAASLDQASSDIEMLLEPIPIPVCEGITKTFHPTTPPDRSQPPPIHQKTPNQKPLETDKRQNKPNSRQKPHHPSTNPTLKLHLKLTNTDSPKNRSPKSTRS